ncbi:hypothetical protein AMECASPLE_010909 [Ameca splendens]|uniref:Uncharacterized protein n=1 Tax=Ameca splendens TaxID=208324 RepID=A0ABV0Y0S3_9TELE
MIISRREQDQFSRSEMMNNLCLVGFFLFSVSDSRTLRVTHTQIHSNQISKLSKPGIQPKHTQAHAASLKGERILESQTSSVSKKAQESKKMFRQLRWGALKIFF